MKNALTLGILLAVLAAVGGAYTLWGDAPATPGPATPQLKEGEYGVVLTPDGFVPEILTIKKGETVVFSNTTGNLFWPASNLHPSHLEYAAFDPKAPIPANQTWSFTFDQAGEWEYHDHLAPYFTGVITVTE